MERGFSVAVWHVNEGEPSDANVGQSSACSLLNAYRLLFGSTLGSLHYHHLEYVPFLYIHVENVDADSLKVKAGSSYVHEEYPQWSTIHLLSGILYQHIQAAERDLVQASMLAPMYGVIQCIRVAFAEASTM